MTRGESEPVRASAVTATAAPVRPATTATANIERRLGGRLVAGGGDPARRDAPTSDGWRQSRSSGGSGSPVGLRSSPRSSSKHGSRHYRRGRRSCPRPPPPMGSNVLTSLAWAGGPPSTVGRHLGRPGQRAVPCRPTCDAWVGAPDCGAVVTFTGTVRDHADGRTGVTALDYEAYEEQAVPRLGRGRGRRAAPLAGHPPGRRACTASGDLGGRRRRRRRRRCRARTGARRSRPPPSASTRVKATVPDLEARDVGRRRGLGPRCAHPSDGP